MNPARPSGDAIYFLAQMAIGIGGLAVSHHPAWRNPFAGMTGLHLLRSRH